MIGADVIKISRIKRALQSERFATRVFTEAEREYANSKTDLCQTYAGIYAAKEAIAKLSGKGIKGPLTDIEITHSQEGAPKVSLKGKIKELFSGDVYVSISHDGDYAFAVATTFAQSVTPVLPGKEIVDGDIELFKRDRFTHKGDYGRVYVIGGSPLMIGAPFMCAQAAVRAGAGLTTLCVAHSLLTAYQARVKEIMLLDINDENGYQLFDEVALKSVVKKADSIAIGMGMGKNDNLIKTLEYLFINFDGIVICDADGINALARDAELLTKERKCKLILTPHVGEFERLKLALNARSVEEAALKCNAVIACKSAYTVISDGIKTYKVTSGCAAMAKGGSGDALAGIIAAYVCRTNPLEATAFACHYFGRSGEKAAKQKGENAVTATDIIESL